jgi:histidine triad (HIT) family protein
MEDKPTCIFCRIIAGEIPSDVVYRDEQLVAFRDIHPLAPIHILIVPRVHIASLNDVGKRDAGLIGHLMLVAKQLAEREKTAQRGYRVVVNSGPDGGQVVPHLHFHLLGGRRLDDELG